MVQNQCRSWLSAHHRKLWQKCRYGCSGDQLDQLSHKDFEILFNPEEPWRHNFINLVGAFLTTSRVKNWQGFTDPLQSVLATLRWRPLWQRAERAGRPGWQHPQWTGLFIPDWDPLIPFNTQLSWSDNTTSLGAWVARVIPTLYATEPDWLDNMPATPLNIIGMQFATWHAMGLGYFDDLLEACEASDDATR
jgi:hypothetical protein